MRALIAAHEAHDHVERRGLAGAVRAEQPHDFAAVDRQAQVLDDLAQPIALGHSERFEPAHCGGAAAAVSVARTCGGTRIRNADRRNPSSPSVTRSLVEVVDQIAALDLVSGPCCTQASSDNRSVRAM